MVYDIIMGGGYLWCIVYDIIMGGGGVTGYWGSIGMLTFPALI